MLPGANDFVGGIYVQSEAFIKGHGDQRHTNIPIENNNYVENSRYAITLHNADDVIARNNTVRGGVNVGIEPAINPWDVNGGRIENNISPMLLENKLKPIAGLVYANSIDTWDTRGKNGVQTADLFSAPGEGDLNFSRLNATPVSPAGVTSAGYRAGAEIGSFSASAAAQMTALLPAFAQNFTVFA